MSCLDSIIGVRGCAQTVQPLFYVDQLPGITIQSLDMIADSDKVTYLGVLQAIVGRAAMRVKSSFINKVGITLETPNSSGCVGRLKEPLVYTQPNPSAVEQGVLFEFKQSKYVVLNLEAIYFRAKQAQQLTFFIKDLVSGDIYDTITVQLQEGENTIVVNKSYYPRRSSNKLLVYYYSDKAGYYETTPEDCYDDCDCSCGCDMLTVCGCQFVKGQKANKEVYSTFGLSVKYSVECSFERLICENSSKFGEAMFWATGIEYLMEVLGSSRLNKFTTARPENNEKLMSTFEARYSSAISGASKSINLCDDCCFKCTEPVSYRYVQP